MYAVHTVVNQIAYLIAGVLDARLAHVLVVIAVFVHHYYSFAGMDAPQRYVMRLIWSALNIGIIPGVMDT